MYWSAVCLCKVSLDNLQLKQNEFPVQLIQPDSVFVPVYETSLGRSHRGSQILSPEYAALVKITGNCLQLIQLFKMFHRRETQIKAVHTKSENQQLSELHFCGFVSDAVIGTFSCYHTTCAGRPIFSSLVMTKEFQSLRMPYKRFSNTCSFQRVSGLLKQQQQKQK